MTATSPRVCNFGSAAFLVLCSLSGVTTQLDAQLWDGWRELLHHYVATPGLNHYLTLRGAVFSERFRKFIAELEPVTERRTVGNLLGTEARPSV